MGLRPLTVGDVGDTYVSWLNDVEVTRFTEARFHEHTPESQRAWVEEHSTRDDTLLLAIVELPERFVGALKIGPLDPRHGTADLGLLIGEKDRWGRGYATEAIALATALGFERLGARKLTASCYGSNRGSAAAFVKAGWTEEGRRPAQFVGADGQPEDQVLLGVVRG